MLLALSPYTRQMLFKPTEGKCMCISKFCWNINLLLLDVFLRSMQFDFEFGWTLVTRWYTLYIVFHLVTTLHYWVVLPHQHQQKHSSQAEESCSFFFVIFVNCTVAVTQYAWVEADDVQLTCVYSSSMNPKRGEAGRSERLNTLALRLWCFVFVVLRLLSDGLHHLRPGTWFVQCILQTDCPNLQQPSPLSHRHLLMVWISLPL